MQKLINFFKAKSFYHLCKIFVIFGITGSLSLFVSEYILNYIDLGKYISTLIVYLFLKLLFLLVIYQILLILIALIFGEFQYFSRFIKKFLNRFKINKKSDWFFDKNKLRILFQEKKFS